MIRDFMNSAEAVLNVGWTGFGYLLFAIVMGLGVVDIYIRGAEQYTPPVMTVESQFNADVTKIYGAREDRVFPYRLDVRTETGEILEVQSNNLNEMFIGKQICVIEFDRQTRIDPIVYRHDPSCGTKT